MTCRGRQTVIKPLLTTTSTWLTCFIQYNLGVQGRRAAHTIPKVIFAFFVILHITFDSLMYIHANIRKLTRITYILAYGNWYGYRIRKINMKVGSGLQMYTRKFSQLVYIALNITIYCLHIYKHLLYFLCVQILIYTNRTECHRTRITGEANTCKQRARWALYGGGTQNRGKGSITKWVTAEFEFSERHPNPSSP